MTACSALDPLSRFVSASEKSLGTLDTFESGDIEEDAYVNALLAQEGVTLSTGLSDAEKITQIRALFQEIRLLHASNVIAANEVKTQWQTLKSNIETFRSLEATLTEDDKTFIRDIRADLVAERTEIMKTRGQIYDLFQELRGKYNLDHLDLILDHLEQVKEILEQRAAYITFVSGAILDVNRMVVGYLN